MNEKQTISKAMSILGSRTSAAKKKAAKINGEKGATARWGAKTSRKANKSGVKNN